jgi:hypothetical protein
MRTFLLALFILVPLVALADDANKAALFGARTLRCELGPGNVAAWSEGTHEVVIDKGTFNDPPSPEIIDNIDLTAGRARMVGNVGASNVTATATDSGILFVERTLAGNFVVTTVFATDFLAPWYPAVQSRHVLMGDEPMPSQYYGKCRILPG